ncbi:GntR family transcriptional regulator [Caballeronia cordobensis]|uniref:GntR family transcriptional regulator n=1 Tax=Caballeronia cordobensis TaxID=1353886 RepID=A0A158J8V3_CABCO|nr:PLP-dependent aminotransferase family protein [Caballeronia cordobensis]SAL64849.1 GntR family transcriptional regulator [Caballeronia cordobensis]
MALYERLADDVEGLIRGGVYKPGERLPSVRELSKQHGRSISTVIRAYLRLESKGLISSRPQSGFYVRDSSASADDRPLLPLLTSAPVSVSSRVDVSRLVLSTLRRIQVEHAVPLGSPYPDATLFPFDKLNRIAAKIGRSQKMWGVGDALPPGNHELIRQIAKRHLEGGLLVDPNQIIITVGATEAINLALQAIANPGDTVAVESPTFYAMLHAIERLGMRAIEVPTHPTLGIDTDALSGLIERENVKACMLMPNFQNPLGFEMPDEKKEELMALLGRHEIPVVENAVYNELYFGKTTPSTLKAFDKKGLVVTCASFSKSLTAAYRIGWVVPGVYRDKIENLKFLNTLTSPPIPQMAIAEFLKSGGYERHLRRLRKTYAHQTRLTRALIHRFFPSGTRISEPRGGYVLWVEMPASVDAMEVYRQALERGITVGPGHMFSIFEKTYRNFIRINCSSPWSSRMEEALMTVGKIVAFLAH